MARVCWRGDPTPSEMAEPAADSPSPPPEPPEPEARAPEPRSWLPAPQALPQSWLFLVLAGAAGLWLWCAWRSHGLLWPDEIFQSLEPAHRLAFGYGFISWEFQLGARSWLFPGLLAGVLRVGDLLGLSSAAGLVLLTKAFMVAVGLASVAATMRLAAAVAGPRAGMVAGVLVAVFPPHLVLAGKCMSETVCAALVTVAGWLWLEAQRNGIAPATGRLSRQRLAGALTVTATFVRPSVALVSLGLLLALLALRQRQQARAHGEGMLLAGAAAGALDWLTWGAPFHSLWRHLHYNVIQGRAADYGSEPLTFYLSALWTSTAPALLLVVPGLVLTWRLTTHADRTRPLLLIVLGYLVVHSLLPHKELRFLMPVMPLALALAAMGLERGWRWWADQSRGATVTGAILLILLSGTMIARAPRLTYADMGERRFGELSTLRVGEISEGWNRLLLRLHAAPDLCGLAVAGVSVIWLGGYSYLHRQVPFFDLLPTQGEEWRAAGANYLLAPAAWPVPSGAQVVGRWGTAALYRFPRRCAAVPPGHELFSLPPSGGEAAAERRAP